MRAIHVTTAALGVFMGVLLPMAAQAELLPPPPPRSMPANLPMDSNLYATDREISSKPRSSAAELARDLALRGLVVHEGRVHVEIVAPEGVEALSRVDVRRFGGIVDRGFRNRVDAWVPPDQLVELATSLPAGFFLEPARQPQLDPVAGQGPGINVTNSIGYRDGGADGGGITIGVIDTEYTGLTAARNNGDAPPAANTTNIDFATGAFESGGPHGTGCVEAVFDHCPDATYRLYKVDSAADLGAVVENAINNGVDILSHSISWFNEGWNDDVGPSCNAANAASIAGIFFVTSAGNRALDHWQGNFNPGNGSANWHDWATGDEALELIVPPAATATAAATFYLSWNTTGGTFDYDLYLYDATLTNILASSTNTGNTFESMSWMNTGTSNATVVLAVARVSGGVTQIEIFGDNESRNYEYTIAAGSTTSPSNASGAFVYSIGAVNWNSYNAANGATPIESYSGQGPSNNGAILPDFVGPTGTTGFTYPGGFGGTSGATPNVAGAIGALWSDKTGWSFLAINFVVREQARRLWRDWGTAGRDNVYGDGPIRIVDFAPNTVWVSRDYNNQTNQPTGPLYTAIAGRDAAVLGGRLLFFPGGLYPEVLTINKDLRVETAGAPARLGP